MKNDIMILEQLKKATESCRKYNQQAQIESKVSSLKSTILNYSEETKRFLWRSKVLKEIFSEKIEVCEIDSNIFSVFEKILNEMYSDPTLSKIAATEETISQLTATSRSGNDELFRILQDKDRDIQKIISAKMAASKIKDLVGPSMLTAIDKRNYMEKIRSKLFNPAGKNITKEFESLLQAWRSFQVRLKAAPSFDTLQKKYGFNDKTINVIKKLVSGSEITLWELTPQILTEIKKLGRFSGIIILRVK